jgi:hypothetical protein
MRRFLITTLSIFVSYLLPIFSAERGDETWWSLQPVDRPDVPEVSDTSWVRNPIDHFVLAKLELEGLKPSPEADKQTLTRRLYFDLGWTPAESRCRRGCRCVTCFASLWRALGAALARRCTFW